MSVRTLNRIFTHQQTARCVGTLLIIAACGGGSRETPITEAEPVEFDPAVVAFVNSHWQRPVPPQGDPPEAWAPINQDLSPAACSTCHPAQYADWQTTLHAHAYSPGLEGQLIPWFENSAGNVQACMACHGPLAEQLRQIVGPAGTYVENPDYDPALERNGVVCAACHVRKWQPHGPPRRDGSTTPAPAGTPHDGAVRDAAFESSSFCGVCHQFEQPAPNGKPLENTVREWQVTNYAREGISCQSCHMPDRKHLWRGIHDPEMTRSGVTPEWVVEGDPDDDDFEVRITLINTGTGHHFPTYVTPAVDLELIFLDAAGEAIAARRRTLQRDVFFDGKQWVEREDDRIPAGGSESIRWHGEAPEGAVSVTGRVVVRPDAFYANMFNGLVTRTPEEAPQRPILVQARTIANNSPYELFSWSRSLTRS